MAEASQAYLWLNPLISSTQDVEKKMVGDTGFEPVTSTLCKMHKFWAQFCQGLNIPAVKLLIKTN